MAEVPGLPWISGLDRWRREVTTELEALPATLRMFREGVSNFQRITKRLLDATDALEQVAQFSVSGLIDTRRRIEDVNRLLQQQVTSPSRELVTTAVSELTDTLTSLARLNPLWHRPGENPSTGSPGVRATDPAD